jgi:hypothetical protein
MTPWTVDNETDTRFPSGPWKGFFLQPSRPGRNWMEMRLTFARGSISGPGRDFVGKFQFSGKYDLETGKCVWSKQYVDKHTVAYQGYNEGKGIWGVWEIPPAGRDGRGGFHIWPDAMGDPTGSTLHAEEDIPVPEFEPVPAMARLWSDADSRHELGF